MAVVELWLQIENRHWDLCPNNFDRMHGMAIQAFKAPPITMNLHSPESGANASRIMYHPIGAVNAQTKLWENVQEALIIRRYTPNWAAPDDRKVNPWDLNEPDPTDTGTMGTIPGATIECNVGDSLVVHFRNKDFRTGKSEKARMHSLHPHGVVFNPRYDGAYPLSPPDTTQSVPASERLLWDAIGVTGAFKQGDRVPVGGTFTYTWETFNWPSTAGVWHYHDHSICDVENVGLGALGFLIVHNPNDPDDVVTQDLPNGQFNGSPTRLHCINFEPVPFPDFALERAVKVMTNADHTLPEDLEIEGNVVHGGAGGDGGGHHRGVAEATGEKGKVKTRHVAEGLAVRQGDFVLNIHPRDLVLRGICFRVYRNPPQQATYLQYYHEFPGTGMVINGRKYLGNTPTLVAGRDTKMRFGLAAMNANTFHTFHLHGHRWVLPGADGNTAGAIQSSPQVTATSQFEDTRLFGPANSFGFTINQGSFMGSRFTPTPARAPGLGEWHMHCHVLHHMMPDGMMGSLLVVNPGQFAPMVLQLPRGEVCDSGPKVGANKILVMNTAFAPNFFMVPSGTVVTFDFQEATHTVTTVSVTGTALPIEINLANGAGTNPADKFTQVSPGTSVTRTITGSPGDVINYECGIHGNFMSGTIHVM